MGTYGSIMSFSICNKNMEITRFLKIENESNTFIKTTPWRWLRPTNPALSMVCLLMTCRHKEPMQQQTWQWPSLNRIFNCPYRNDYFHLSQSVWWEFFHDMIVTKNNITLLMLEMEYSCFGGPIPCLLMPWLLKSPEHQHAWFCQCRIGNM